MTSNQKNFILFFFACYIDLSTAMTDKKEIYDMITVHGCMHRKPLAVKLLACDSAERRIIAAHVTTGNVRGKLECYFAPQNAQSIFRIYINKLDLQRRSGGCPSFKLIGYTVKMLMPEVQEDWVRPDRRIEVPSDPSTLAHYDCNNYETAAGKIIESGKTGQKLVMEFDTKNIANDRNDDVNFVVSSYVSGPSYSCPADTFRCWETRHVCIPTSLECDGVNNCYDNSDEENFKCSGKIAGMLLPLFIVMIVLLILFLIAVLIIGILFYRRRRRRRQKLEEARRREMDHHGMTSPYYITSSHQSLPYLPPETSNSRTNLA